MARRVAHYLRRYAEDRTIVEAFPSYGAAVARAKALLVASDARFVEIFDVDPRAHPDARPLAARLG